MPALLIELRWPDGRFHGVRADTRYAVPEWPPSPFRLFQALVAGACGGRWIAARADTDAALRWLETLEPPRIVAPAAMQLRPVNMYVPNNDADIPKVGGDPAQISEIRAAKTLRPQRFDADLPVTFLWTFSGDTGPAEQVAELAQRLHTLGHGIDAAYARAEVLDEREGTARLMALRGAPYRPSGEGGPAGRAMPCPASGSLESLHLRHAAMVGRFTKGKIDRAASTLFTQPPKPHFRNVVYERPAVRLLYELRSSGNATNFRAWPLTAASACVAAVRDLLARRLEPAWPGEVARFVIGRGAGAADVARRLHIVPLPSIGMAHTDPAIRRVLVLLPPDHPIPVRDVEWALAGQTLEPPSGAQTGTMMAPADDRRMLHRFTGSAQAWQTITPAVLPNIPGPRRTGQQRATAEQAMATAVATAARHAGIAATVTDVTVQREPFGSGEAADNFMPDRFAACALRHVRVTFATPVAGPLLLGDGRFLGLGVLHPTVRDRLPSRSGIHAFAMRPLETAILAPEARETLLRHARRAIMARAQAVPGRLRVNETLPVFFTGHAPGEGETGPARDGTHDHIFLALDLGSAEAPRLLVIAPHRADRTRGSGSERLLSWLAEALAGWTELRAGAAGRWALAASPVDEADPLLRAERSWQSVTPYQQTRGKRRGSAPEPAVVEDVRLECRRRALPVPDVSVLRLDAGTAWLRLRFAVAVKGPLLLGAGSHFGAGLFAAADD